MGISRRRIIRTGIFGTSLAILGGASPATATSDEQSIVEGEIKGVLRTGLPQYDEARKEFTMAFADEVCDKCGEFTDLEISKYEEQAPSSTEFRRAVDLAGILNEYVDAGIPTEVLEDLYEGSRKVERYIPLVVSSKRVVDAACDFQDTESRVYRERFYIALLILIAECALFSSVATYRASFSATRYLANNLLVSFRNRFGFRLYAILLREVHWAIRGTISGVPGYIWEKSDELAKDHHNFDYPGIREVLNTDIISIRDWIRLEFGIG